MPVRMVWEDDEKTILHHIYEGVFTADEFHWAVDENYRLQNTVSHPVDVISDLTGSSSQIRFVLSSAARHVETKVPANQRLVIVVGGSMFIKTLLNIGKTIAPKTTGRVMTVNSLEEALRLIRKYRNQLAASGAGQ